MNSLALVNQAIDLGCDFAEIDVWENEEFLVARAAAQPGDPLAAILARPIGLYIDFKSGRAPQLAQLLEGRDKTLVWANDLQQLAALPGANVMPQAIDEASLHAVLTRFSPTHIAFDDHDFTPALVAVAKAAGAKVFVDRLRESDNPWKWEEAQQWGADGIQTDRPRELLQWLGR